MKRIYNYIFLSVFAFAAAGCLEDDLNPDGQLGNSGDEVQFGLSLNDPSTKTIYGTEYTNESNQKFFPIYWSEGDKIQIASPQCVAGRQSAEYLVTPSTETTGQGYAVAMTKTGDYGVQWGNEETADFYSIYPSNGTSWTTLELGDVVAKLNVASEQSANLVLTPAETTESKDNEGNTVTTIVIPGVYQAADMSNVIMYSQASADKGDVVKLNYKPYSTILEFELGIAQNKDQQGNLVPEDSEKAIAWGTVKVVSMTLIAPTGISIAGDFTLKFNGSNAPVITAAGNNSNSIKVVFATQPLLNEENRTLKTKLSMIPISGITTLDGWMAAIEVLEGTDTNTKTYTKTFSGSGNKTALAPGKIHKIQLPRFSSTEKWEVNTEAWIPTLEDYKNIYLTELSLPGAWYAGAPTDDGYQSTQSVTDLWNAGVRAFATECRTSSTNTGQWYNPNYTPSSIVVSGTQSNAGILGDYCTGGTQIRTIIKSIADAAAGSVVYDDNGNIKDGEFAVFVFSYADGGSDGHRDVDHAYFIKGIQNEIAQSGATNIYASEITANTTIADVIGKLIIKVNVDDRLPNDTYDGKMNALISYNPLVQQLTDVDYSTPLFSKMYWKAWNDNYRTTTTANANDFLWCFSSANRTQVNPEEEATANATIPTYAQRQTALRGMMEHSREITANSGHNIWFYFNAGGTQTTSQTSTTTSGTSFASEMNSWLLDLIKLKANGGTDSKGVLGTAGAYIESDPSPLGIVMFNQCTNATYHGPDIIREIIEMNNKFKLQRKQGTKAQSAAASYSSGMHDQNVAAFGWD